VELVTLHQACKQHFIDSMTPLFVEAYMSKASPSTQIVKARASAHEWATARWKILIEEREAA
jgi:hypothetical protein